MSLANDYRRQAQWRDWPTAFAALPSLEGKTILDIGCAIGDQAAELTAHGARVIGIDSNDDLLAVARKRGIPNAEFRKHELNTTLDVGEPVHGVWCSFVAAYFVDLEGALRNWTSCLERGGFIALTEIDELFAHEPVSDETRKLLDDYVDDAFRGNRYDFRAGRKLRPALEAIGFTPSEERLLTDSELSFFGPATPDVLEAWQSRFDRMLPLQKFCGDRFDAMRADFLAGLAHPDHRSNSRVILCVASA